MKLRYRLIISFCIILFVPIIVAGIVLYGLSLLQDRANAQANGYDFIISSIQILNQSTASQYPVSYTHLRLGKEHAFKSPRTRL